MRFEDQRAKMVAEQLVARGISDPLVLGAFAKVKRECFVGEQFRSYAYFDNPLSIGHEQTISQPYIVALMMSMLCLRTDDRVLEIGTGSGYQTALLAEVCKEVYTIERIESLMKTASERLNTQGYKNIFYKLGDGAMGWVNTAPAVAGFDKIVVSAASAKVPEALFAQLVVSGRLVAPVGPRNVQELILYEKLEGGGVRSSKECDVVFVPLVTTVLRGQGSGFGDT